MKKFLLAAAVLAALFASVSCGGSGTGSDINVEGELSDLFTKIYENAEAESPAVMYIKVDETNKKSMLGTEEVNFTEALASEAAIMTIPHSIVLIRVDGNTDIEKTKKLIRENADPRKWICVGVEDDEVIVDSLGNLIILIMSENADAYHKAFLKLAE